MRRFPTHSSANFGVELTYAGYKYVPVSHLACEGDVIISAKAQRDRIELIERQSANKVDATSIKAGHYPIVSASQYVTTVRDQLVSPSGRTR